MIAHWKYLNYVLRHKWYVFLWCCRYWIPFAGIVHDLSKFHPSEWFPYVDYFYGGDPERSYGGNRYPDRHYGDWRNYMGEKYTQAWVDARFDAAWNHHQKRNPHHWQYWVLHEDSGKTACIAMPDRYRREMLADWRGAGMAINGKDDTRNWYLKNRTNMLLHPNTRQWIESELGLLANIDGTEVSIAEMSEWL